MLHLLHAAGIFTAFGHHSVWVMLIQAAIRTYVQDALTALLYSAPLLVIYDMGSWVMAHKFEPK